MLDYTIKRSRRKTLAAHVLPNGEVEVRAPLSTPVREIEQFLSEREDTLKKYIADQIRRAENKRAFSPDIGTEIIYMGKPYGIERGGSTRIGDGRFYVTAGSVKNQVRALYRMAAEKIIRERAAHFSEITGLIPSSVRINAAKTRWGSCSSKGALNFSWYLIMAGEKEIDYVVIHELSHIKHMNHSPAFWREVAKYEPEYNKRRAALRSLARRLQNEDWD